MERKRIAFRSQCFPKTKFTFAQKKCAFLLVLVILVIEGCSIHVGEVKQPYSTESTAYSTGESDGKVIPTGKWWLVFEDPLLNRMMESLLTDNLSLSQAVARLQQARSLEQQARAVELAQLDLNYDYSTKKESGANRSSSREADLGLSWEIDLWGRVRQRSEAAGLQSDAAEQDIEDVALVVSFQLAKTYYQLVEQGLQLNLLEKQIEVNSIYRDLVELRFSNGAASIVDVYQQRQLLMGKKAKVALTSEEIVFLENRLQVLMGLVPKRKRIQTSNHMPALPPVPHLGVPADLLHNRPDLRSLYMKLEATHHLVAAAIAERLPQLRIGGNLGLSNGTSFYSFFVDAFGALIDWGKRKSEVERQKAVAQEKASFYAEAYLQAVEEVENSLWREHHHLALIKNIEAQLSLARETLVESRNRYLQGLTDYLPVLAALQTVQNLEQGHLARQREQIENRLVLYRAIGGSTIDYENSFLLHHK